MKGFLALLAILLAAAGVHAAGRLSHEAAKS